MKEKYKNIIEDIIEVALEIVIKSIIGITMVVIFALVCKAFELSTFPFIFFLC